MKLQSHISTILIANRGEIASRIIRTCKKMGIRSIAVFSEADRNAPYVKEADTAICIGENAPAASYLNQDRIIDAAKLCDADAIHPGYGFLSENATFAKRCLSEGITFIGPHAEAIEMMGSKSKAKTLMLQHQVPVVPGYDGADQTKLELANAAKRIGLPVLIKASAGGGGKGMRIVYHENELEKAIDSAKSESMNAFGNDELLIEKYIASGRHIEFQVFGDQHGNLIHLLERECTIQRRYQKIVEESPSPVLTEEIRKKMGAAAVQAAKAIQYDNAGTVEFIFDELTGEFYFLEVNTRLQVEHPVTEAITGMDLVQMQIESAQGMPLFIKQNEVKGNGYAMEVRLYAENASNNFLPETGTIHKFRCPQLDGLRIESGVADGSEISIHYDPMIAKIIVHDINRVTVHRKMEYVLRNLICTGVVTNQDFLLKIIQNQNFRNGNYDTHFIEKNFTLNKIPTSNNQHLRLAGIAATLYGWNKRNAERKIIRALPSGWRNSFYDFQKESFNYNNEQIDLAYAFKKGEFIFKFEDIVTQVKFIATDGDQIILEINNLRHRFTVTEQNNIIHTHNENTGNIILIKHERFPVKSSEKSAGNYAAPMPSQIIKVLVNEGQMVKTGEPLVILSSMKMENTIVSEADGIIDQVYAVEGTSVGSGFQLLKLK